MGFHRGPFTGDDAVNTGIPDGPIWSDLIAAQDAIQLCTQTLNASAALVIKEMRAQLNANAIHLVKGMSKQHELAFRIQCCALHAFAIPG